jgi:ATP/maltotriose-dependent transcriptional regulator MalT
MTPLPGAVDERLQLQGRTIARSRLAAKVASALESGSVIITAGAGSGKTTILEQALDGRTAAWLSCSDGERAPGTLLMRIVQVLADAAPGTTDAMAERLAGGVERVETRAATRELIAELSRLLVEPLVLVIDDAEQLDGATGSEQLISALIRAEVPLLRIALASRRPLDLRIAKPRTAGLLTELSAADLAFDTEECSALLRTRTGLDPTPEQIESVMGATEGWPLGVALAATVVGRRGGDSPRSCSGHWSRT